MILLDAVLAGQFARETLGHLGQEYPYKLDHVLNGPEDAVPPIQLHPIFHGSYDWHSCVHGWWQVLRLARLFPDMPEAAAIRGRADVMLVADKVAGELAYLDRPQSAGFERPYGWGWLLALHHETSRHAESSWSSALEPLARAFAARFQAFLPKMDYPIRVGAHPNSSFALTWAYEWATTHDPALVTLIRERARHWFGEDRGCQAWEPGGDEFLSSALTEALLMSRVLDHAAFADWFSEFLPDVAEGRPTTLFTPATVSDRTDGKIAHLDGLNLSRAWCWRSIATALGDAHAATPLMRAAADRHIAASLRHIADHYMGQHWLATFALLAVES